MAEDARSPVTIRVTPCRGAADLLAVRGFLVDYARMLERDEGMVPDTHGLAREIEALPGEYVPPSGGIWLARGAGDQRLGCVALRPREMPGLAEIKRLWVAPEGRGRGAGRALLQAVIASARDMGLARLVLDTAPGMAAAHALYHGAGFEEIPPYDGTPMPGLLYFGRAV